MVFVLFLHFTPAKGYFCRAIIQLMIKLFVILRNSCQFYQQPVGLSNRNLIRNINLCILTDGSFLEKDELILHIGFRNLPDAFYE